MPKKYEIKKPEKCQSCDKADQCDFLTRLFQKPFDAIGVLLDCKAFYFVFCDLEERCKIPFNDPEKLRQYDEETEAGKRPFLTPALVTNGVLAAELALKALTLKETGTFDCIHDLDKLFYSLPDVHKNAISTTIKEKAQQSDVTLKKNLGIIHNFFEDWRYFFEHETMGYSSFLLEFIHIVCEYAISENEKSLSEVDA